MGTTAEKGAYLNETKSQLKTAINNLGGNIDNETTFREYVEELQDVYDNYPKTSYGEGTSITLENCNKGKLDVDKLEGDTSQDGEPTPTNPVTISSVTGNQEVVVRGKNYFTNTYNGTSKFSVAYQNEVLTIEATQDTTGNQVFYRSKVYGNLKNGQTYIVSSTNVSGVVENLKLQLRNKDGTSASLPMTTSVVYDDNYDLYVVSNVFGSASSVQVTEGQTAVIKDIMVEEGNSTTTYEPYITPITKTLALGSIELNKIGTYQDYIYKSGDKWYVHKEITKRSILDIIGERTVQYISARNQFAIDRDPISDIKNNSSYSNQNYTPTFMCNSYISKTYASSLADTGYAVSYLYVDAVNNRQLRFKNADITSVDTFISSVANDYLVYPIETATNTEITDTTLINQLEALYNAQSIKGTTIIESNGDLPIIIKARALKGES